MCYGRDTTTRSTQAAVEASRPQVNTGKVAVDTIADRKVAAESATGFKIGETVATFDGIKVVVGFGRVNFPHPIGINGDAVEPARALLVADLTELAEFGSQAVAVESPNNVHKLADHPGNAAL